ncbi:MAG: phage capsid protein [Alphaproteobacteria bacterium]
MSENIDKIFTKHFEAEVHTAYQRTGSKLRNMVRTKNNIKGATAVFQKVGKGTASTKARHGLVPVMSMDFTPVECNLYDYYAGDWVDSLDELKTNVDERQVVAAAGAYALGRKTDELIINALSDASNSVGDYSTGISKSLILQAFAKINAQDVPDDGQRFGLVGVNQWNELLNIKEFSDSDYVGEDLPWLNGTESRKWLGIVWLMHTGLTLNNTKERDCYIFHKTAVGHASGQDVKSDITWHGDHAANFISNSMSQGACLIDNTGIVKIKCDDTATLVEA